MFSKLSFGQKLAVWLGCAVMIVISGITAIYFQLSKSPPKDMDKLIPKWAHGFDLKHEETWAKTEDFSTIQIEQNPKAAFWYKERGYARWWLKKYDGAITDFTKAIALDPKDYTSFAYRGQLYSHRKQYKQAIDDLTKAIELNPKSGRYYYSRGIAYHWLDEVDKALADYDKAIEFGYDLRKSHSGKASLHGRMKNFEKAISEYEAAAKCPLRDEDDETLDRLTRLYVAEAQFENAKKSAEQWVEETHDNRAYRTLISICDATGDKEKAMIARNQFINKLSERIAEDSSNGASYEERASIYKELGDKTKADSDYNRALELCKTLGTPLSLSQQARICKDAGRSDEAKELYAQEIASITNEISKKPDAQSLYLNRAFALINIGKYKAALQDLDKAKNSQNENAILHSKYDVAVAQGNYVQALELLKKSNKPMTYRLYSQQARLFERMGRHADAIDAAHKAMDLEKTNSFAYYWLGKALGSSGQLDESKIRLQQAKAYGYNPKD